jgi:tRNA A-37 threonylcarbamoyl transferase component Bud32
MSGIEGIHPGSEGMGAQMIRAHSEFGSGWRRRLTGFATKEIKELAGVARKDTAEEFAKGLGVQLAKSKRLSAKYGGGYTSPSSELIERYLVEQKAGYLNPIRKATDKILEWTRGVKRDVAYADIAGMRKAGLSEEEIKRTIFHEASERLNMRSLLGKERVSEAIEQKLPHKLAVAQEELFVRHLGSKQLLKETLRMREAEGTRLVRFSGRDDAWNTIEAEFGSGWDPLRKIATKIYGGTEGSFAKLLKSKEFQEALKSATPGEIIGEGMFGAARRMEGSFRGKTFSFVRKTGDIGEEEVKAMMASQKTVAPSVYSHGPGQIDMELFSGTALGALDPGKISSLKPDVAAAFSKIHSRGFEHGDPHLGNVFLTKENKIGIIDFGSAKALSAKASKRTASGDIEMVSKLIKARSERTSQLAAVDPFAAADPFASQQVDIKDVLRRLPKKESAQIEGLSRAASRNKKFHQISKEAVGVGLRQAHNAGRRHGKFASSGEI